MPISGSTGRDLQTALERLRKLWPTLSDDDKQGMLDTVAELAGGTIGAFAGSGLASVPAAAAGAVAGRNLSRLAGTAAGLKTSPTTVKQELIENAKTAAGAAVGEGVGRALPLAYRGVKSLGTRAAKWAVKPDEEIVKLAAADGVPITPGMVTRRPVVKQAQVALEKLPGSSGTIRQAVENSQSAWEGSLAKKGAKIGPEADDVQAGTALKEGLDSNYDAKRATFTPKYAELKAHDGVKIDMTQAREAARQLLDNVSPDTAKFFPGTTLARLRQIARMGVETTKEEAPKTLYDASGNAIKRVAEPKRYIDAPDGLRDVDELPELNFGEARKLRTQLLEAQRNLTRNNAAFDRQAIPSLLGSVDASIDETLGATAPDALNKWREISGQYRQVAEKLTSNTGKKIDAAKVPERLPSQIGKNPTMIAEADAAVNPATVDVVAGKASGRPNPMPAFRRNRYDALVESSRTQMRNMGDDRYVNAHTLEKKAAGTPTRELFGPEADAELKGSIKLGKAIASPDYNFGNPSGTARNQVLTSSAIGLGSTLLPGERTAEERTHDAVKIGIGAFAVPKLAAKVWTGPLARAAVKTPPPFTSGRAGGPLVGAAGRAIMSTAKLPERADEQAEADFFDYSAAPRADNQNEPDFFDYDAMRPAARR